MNCCKQIIKSHFNKNFVMSVDDEERFQSRNKCLVCNKLLMREIIRDVKTSVKPNGLEKYIAYTANKTFVFIDSMQFINSSLDSLVT